MKNKHAIIISPLPLRPVKSGMQNTICLLNKYLIEKNYKVFFIHIKTKNKIDPVLNLKIDKDIIKNLKKKLNLKKIDLIFINTSKILFQYKELLFSKHRIFKTILVCHDLYYFRKKYFDKINVKDKTKITYSEEKQAIKKVDFIIDFSKTERDYLLKNDIPKKKLIKTNTPTSKFKMHRVTDNHRFDLVYISSNWYQNHLSLKSLFDKIKVKNCNFKILILGYSSIINHKNIFVKSYSKQTLYNSKIGVAIMKNQTGRQTKIFEMLSAGVPIITNINLSEFGLKNNFHYKYVDKKIKLSTQLKTFISDEYLRKKLSKNSYNWSQKNTLYKKAFKQINNLILI